MSNNNKPDSAASPDQTQKKKPSTAKVIQGILAGALGVQSSKAQEEDFASSSPWPYIIAAVLFGVGFVVSLMLIVSWVLSGG